MGVGGPEISDGLETLRRVMSLREIVSLIERTARWVSPATVVSAAFRRSVRHGLGGSGSLRVCRGRTAADLDRAGPPPFLPSLLLAARTADAKQARRILAIAT